MVLLKICLDVVQIVLCKPVQNTHLGKGNGVNDHHSMTLRMYLLMPLGVINYYFRSLMILMRWVGDGPPLAFIFAIFCSTHKVNRFKGLGEMNKQQLRETIFDVQKRKLTKVTITDFQSDNTIVDINSLPKNNPSSAASRVVRDLEIFKLSCMIYDLIYI